MIKFEIEMDDADFKYYETKAVLAGFTLPEWIKKVLDSNATHDMPQQKGNSFRKEAIEVLIFLNTKAEKNFEPVNANLEKISARLREGNTVQDLKTVIAIKVREWKNDEHFRKYLRPSTLFNREKFAQYKGELKKAIYATMP